MRTAPSMIDMARAPPVPSPNRIPKSKIRFQPEVLEHGTVARLLGTMPGKQVVDNGQT